MLSDEDLVWEARRGSTRAFSALMTRHQGAVRSFARRVTDNAADGDDIAQEAFVHAWSRLKSLNEPSRFRSWILGVTWCKAKTRLRGHARDRARDAAWLEGQAQSGEAVGEAAMTAMQLFATLPQDQRAALALCHGEGWSHAEAAQILDQTLGTVKSNIRRARTALSTRLGGEDDPA